jgi:hypothetical protein
MNKSYLKFDNINLLHQYRRNNTTDVPKLNFPTAIWPRLAPLFDSKDAITINDYLKKNIADDEYNKRLAQMARALPPHHPPR